MKLFFLVTLLLVGCQTAPQRTIYDGARDDCIQVYGYKQGTDEFKQCFQSEVQSRREMATRMLYGR
jgi:hypothetical protein